MSGSKSLPPAGAPAGSTDASAAQDRPLGLTVYDLPTVGADTGRDPVAVRRGRFRMLLLFLICAAPVVASYLTYYVWRPDGRRNYGELIQPQRALPDWNGWNEQGQAVPLSSLKDQWLFISVADSACDAQCERHLYLQRQLREGLGKDKDRLDWVWLRTGDVSLTDALREATARATVLRVDADQLASWLQPAEGQRLSDHLYVVDPMGHWMMRFPADADPARVRRDLERLLRASSFWDKAGR